jgi:hypothetical protein
MGSGFPGSGRTWTSVNAPRNIICSFTRNREQILVEQPESLTPAINLLSDTRRVSPSLLSADEKILRHNLVTSIQIVRKRLRKLPRDPAHYETVVKIIEELREELRELSADLRP